MPYAIRALITATAQGRLGGSSSCLRVGTEVAAETAISASVVGGGCNGRDSADLRASLELGRFLCGS